MPALPSVRRNPSGSGTVEPVCPAAGTGSRHDGDRSTAHTGEAAGTHLPAPGGPATSRGESPRAAGARPHAPLVAHLIATHLGLPQTRVLRRGSAAQAEDAYRRREPADPPVRARGGRTI